VRYRRSHLPLAKLGNVVTLSIPNHDHVGTRLIKRHGKENWRKLKAVAVVRLADGSVRRAEIHWYEAHGIGKVSQKARYFLD
jgi:phosphoglycerate-specific signal transduction histidine kinase